MQRRYPIAGSLILFTVFGVAAFGDAPATVLRVQQRPAGLFLDAPGQPARDRSNDPTVMRSRPVTIRFDALTDASAADAGRVPRSMLVLNLFDHVSYTAVLGRIDPAAAPWPGARVSASGAASDRSSRCSMPRTGQA